MQDPNKPAGAPTDFQFSTPEEREARLLKNQALQEAENEFKREQELLAERKRKNNAERARIQNAAKTPAKMVYLLAAKKHPHGESPTLYVVGMYSTMETLAEHLIEATNRFALAAQNIGVVEFDLSVLRDRPAVDPR